jgi:hypothetical protein
MLGDIVSPASGASIHGLFDGSETSALIAFWLRSSPASGGLVAPLAARLAEGDNRVTDGWLDPPAGRR